MTSAIERRVADAHTLWWLGIALMAYRLNCDSLASALDIHLLETWHTFSRVTSLLTQVSAAELLFACLGTAGNFVLTGRTRLR